MEDELKNNNGYAKNTEKMKKDENFEERVKFLIKGK
jgi:hypothetical protein